MTSAEKAAAVIKDILAFHLPRVQEGLEKGYVDENQILVIYDHATRARIYQELADSCRDCGGPKPCHCTNDE